MKKILLTSTIVALLFAACNKDPNNGQDPNNPETETVKKLPSKMIDNYQYIGGNPDYPTTITVEETTEFLYDDINRLVKIIEHYTESYGKYTRTDTTEITYNANNNPVRITERGRYSSDNTITDFKYNNNQVLEIRPYYYYSDFGSNEKYVLDTTILTINANGQVIKVKRWDLETVHETCGFYCDTAYVVKSEPYEIEYFYNSNGNLVDMKIVGGDSWGEKITYSNVLSIYRHINTQDWVVQSLVGILSNGGNGGKGLVGKKGYMPSSIGNGENEFVKFTYGLYPDGYVRQMDYEGEDRTSITTFEYISAK